MIYVLAFFFPYIALAVRGLWIQAIFNFILCVIGYVCILTGIGAILGIPFELIAVVWGITAILQNSNKKQHQEMLDALKNKD
ncbi:hypothetical protein [Campylobacter helveticus]|uniref:hypothetical protein n=1 Tax=Campylobacter helveticus TaxID=28898 RepID=UPI001112712F|nr:hypothetical protein [Campylobacter helveticus]MCR2056674.1 hypothetical protein [Campylobacter helveticus]TNB63848.1 hypothetical protein FDW43_03445 [Campylobacter helveticus]